MLARFNYHLSKADYVAGLTVLADRLARRDTARERRIWEQIGSFVFVILVTGVFFPEAVIGLFVAAGLFGLSELLLRSRAMSQLHGISYDAEVAEIEVEITETQLTERAGPRQRQWTWEAVRAVHERDSMIIFELAGWDMFALPGRVWNSDDERIVFLGEVRTRLAANAGAVNGCRGKPTVLPQNLIVGSIAIGVDVMFVGTFLLLPPDFVGPPPDRGTGVAIALAIVTLLLAASYAAYRVIKLLLGRMHARSPKTANLIAQLPLWLLLLLFILLYLGIL